MKRDEMEKILKEKFSEIFQISGQYGTQIVVEIQESRPHGFDTLVYDSETESLYTNKNLGKIIATFKERFEARTKEYQEWLESSQAKEEAFNHKVKKFAEDTAIAGDHHGVYQSGDDISIYVMDAVTGEDMEKYHASGEFMALVRIDRSRPYSNAYRSQYGPGRRSDKYLIGQNETGTKFAHQVYDKVKTVEEAVNWIWQDQPVTARQGDIGITPSRTIKHKLGNLVKDYRIMDSHMFTGEIFSNNSIFVRNGVLHHEKDQHPDIFVPADKWYKIVFARRATKGMVGTRD